MRVSPQRLLIPLLVSFSLTGAGVVLIYFLNKKKDEEAENITSIKSKQFSEEFKIPREFVPVIIGRGGSVIQSIRQSTGTKISFKDENDVDLLERTCVITGSPENIKLAEEKFKCILNNQPIIETYETWVPQRTIIRITKRGEELLHQIQNSSNAKIILESSSTVADPESKKRVIIKGTAEQIANALLQVEDKVREDNEARAKTETSSLNRVPRIKTSPAATPENNTKNVTYSKEIFGNQANEGLMEVFVCAMENPSQFYIQVISPTNALLDDLIKDMTEYYEIEENRELHTLTNITAGQIIAAKFTIDNKWYRAEIIADLGEQKYDVYFVDFGDRDKVGVKNIFELRTDFLSLRMQATEVSLAGVKPRIGEWTLEASETFAQLCALANWQPRVAKIRGYKERTIACGPSRREGSPIPCIELYEKRDEQLFNIGKELIKLDLACPESEPWSAASSTLSLSRRSLDSRARSPEALTPATINGSNGSQVDDETPRTIEEIDLTLTPKEKKPSGNVEVIDLTTPAKGPRTTTSSSRNFIENERSSPEPTTRNGSSNGNVHDDGHNNKSRTKKMLPDPFKRKIKPVVYNIVPAGFESELSDVSDEFEFN